MLLIFPKTNTTMRGSASSGSSFSEARDGMLGFDNFLKLFDKRDDGKLA
jgi:hypothetical protein